MNVLPLRPSGYCAGVTAALSLAIKAKEEHPSQNVYLLGLLVHNEDAVAALSKRGLIPLDEREKGLLDYLFELKRGDVVVFSAHGHPEAYEDIARERGIEIVDATCRFVTENLELAKASTRPVLYIGLAGHLESEAFLANCPDAFFYDVKSRRCPGILALKGKQQLPLVITQTTLSKDEIDQAMEDIRVFFPGLEATKERCASTTLRQKAIQELPADVDVVIVLGSTRSNNSLKLAEIAKNKGIETHLCLDLEDVKRLDLKNKKRAALSSGASTSGETFAEVLSYLRDY